MITAFPRLAAFVLVSLFVAASAPAADRFAAAHARLQERLDRALAEFAALRATMAAERVPLAEEIARLENEVIEAGRTLENERRVRDHRSQSLRLLEQQAEREREQVSYVSGLLADFARAFESRVHLAELQRFGARARAAQHVLDTPDLALSERLEAQLDSLTLALDRLDGILGGDRFPGQAVTAQGTREHGTFLVAGPAVYFAAASGAAGLVQTRFNTYDPVALDLGPAAAAAIRTAIGDATAVLPLDATLGKAVQIREASESLFEHIAKGRTVGYVIIALGATALAVAFFKFLSVARYRAPTPDDVQAVLEALARDGPARAREIVAGMSGAAAELLGTGVRHVNDKRRVLEEALYEVVLKARPRLESLLPFLAVTAAAAPLLGLLGTVVGMIRTFSLISIFGTGDAKSLSSGISEALVTTELGLIVAIPALVLHGVLSRLAKNRLAAIEHAAVAFLNGLNTVRESSGQPRPVAVAAEVRDSGEPDGEIALQRA